MSSTSSTLPLDELLVDPANDALKSKQAATEAFLLTETQQDRVDAVVFPSPDDSESDEIEGFTSSETNDSSSSTSASRSSSETTRSDNHLHETNSSATASTTENRTGAICHGRVKNPESMVSKTWWKTVFSDQLYLQTDGDVVEDPAITLEEVRILERIDVVCDILQASSPSSLADAETDVDASTGTTTVKVLDLCCGQGRHILQLAELYPSLELYGHDQSEFLIQLARSRATAAASSTSTYASPNNKNVQFTIGDCRSIPYADSTFDLVLMLGNSFGYFSTDKDDEAVLTQIFRVLRPGGVVALDIADGAFQRENFTPRGWEWIDDEMMVCRERWLSEDRKRLVCREVVIKTGEGVIRDQFYQERLYDSMDMQRLLKGAGLKQLNQAIDGQGTNGAASAKQQALDLEIKTGKEMSQRGEDLGLMEQRNFVVAVKPAL
ncbi:hypothetical protein BGW39_005276 [Mortierella sp. 14UC]|nr:hypothetical protein BGW39_005276 [Mortierella sp. 14UC]